MPRQARVSVADVVYHVINRANGRSQIFHTDKDYVHFELLFVHWQIRTQVYRKYCPCPISL